MHYVLGSHVFLSESINIGNRNVQGVQKVIVNFTNHIFIFQFSPQFDFNNIVHNFHSNSSPLFYIKTCLLIKI